MGVASCLKCGMETEYELGMSQHVKHWVTKCTICESTEKRSQFEPCF